MKMNMFNLKFVFLFDMRELIVFEWIQIVHYKYLGIHVIKYVANYTSSNLPFTSSNRHTHHQVAKSFTLENYNFIIHYQYVSFLSSFFLCKCSLWLNQPRPKVICVWNLWLFLKVKNLCKNFWNNLHFHFLLKDLNKNIPFT
jgi:hypothetical protein